MDEHAPSTADNTTTTPVFPAGWGWPGSARKAHWFAEGQTVSACNRWMFTGPREPDTAPSRDDCVACRRALTRP